LGSMESDGLEIRKIITFHSKTVSSNLTITIQNITK